MLTFRPGYLVTVRPGGIGKYFKKRGFKKFIVLDLLYFMGNARIMCCISWEMQEIKLMSLLKVVWEIY